MMKKRLILSFAFCLFAIIFSFNALALGSEQTVCCEKTIASPEKGVLYCQDVPASQCDPNSRQVPTSCESTSYCKPGVCYNSNEGTCLDNTPQLICNSNEGIWSEESPPQCNLGCCVLGDQAAFVSLVRCKKLSSQLGLQTNYKSNIQNEVQCILEVQNQEKGACVFEKEFEKTCKFTTRGECDTGINKSKSNEFFPGKLCSAEEIGAPCAPTRQTSCIPGKDEVYFIDSCGNPANIYDSSKINDKLYWSNVLDKSKVCGAGGANSNSAGCGNCNYLQGSYCRDAEKGKLPTYGDAICSDLNCKNTANGKSYKHGESWCVYDDAGKTGDGTNTVGSEFYKHICINGEEVLEQCSGFRQQECIEGAIETSVGKFSQAACRVNRWQDCTSQDNKQDCQNTDRRDCFWREGVSILNDSVEGSCLPSNSPGLKFWEGEQTRQICQQANAACVVTFEKKLTGGEECKENCECLTEEWQKDREEICTALGDCGPNTNWIGVKGYKDGFKIETKKA